MLSTACGELWARDLAAVLCKMSHRNVPRCEASPPSTPIPLRWGRPKNRHFRALPSKKRLETYKPKNRRLRAAPAPGPSPAVEEVACWGVVSRFRSRSQGSRSVVMVGVSCQKFKRCAGSQNRIMGTVSRAGHGQRFAGTLCRSCGKIILTEDTELAASESQGACSAVFSSQTRVL